MAQSPVARPKVLLAASQLDLTQQGTGGVPNSALACVFKKLCRGRESSASLNPNKTKVQYRAALPEVMCGMIATSHIENRAIAEVRVTPSDMPLSEIVCLDHHPANHDCPRLIRCAMAAIRRAPE